MSDKRKEIPQFNNEDEEREFWATHDSTEYVDWSKAEKNPAFQLGPIYGSPPDQVSQLATCKRESRNSCIEQSN